MEKTFGGISGARKEAEAEELIRILSHMQEVVSRGIKKACDMEDGICPTVHRKHPLRKRLPYTS